MTTNPHNTINSTQGNTRAVLSWNSRLICLALISLLVTLGAFSSTLGQQAEKDSSDKTPIITVSVVSDGVHIAAPSGVVQLRLEVYDEAGQKLFDTEQKGGDVLEWHLQGVAGERVTDGTYLCVVTFRNPSGRLNQRLGLVTVAAQSITVRPASFADLSPLQAQVLGPIEGEDKGLAVVSQDRLVKWMDSSGTLGNTGVSESNGNVVVGNAAQTGNLQIYGAANQDVFAGMGTDINTGPAFNYGYAGSSFGRSAGFFNVRPDALAVAPNPSLRFMTNNLQRMIVTNTGDVGIGTTSPAAKLDVAGNLKLSGANSSLIFPDGTSMTTAGSGGTPSGTSIVSAVNDAATIGTINDNRLSPNLARLNSANTFTGNQTVNGVLTASAVNMPGYISSPGWIIGGALQFNYANIKSLNADGGTLTVENTTHKVGVGKYAQTYPLEVAGTAAADWVRTGGITFGNGSTQSTAAPISRIWTTSQTGADIEIGHVGSNGSPTFTPVLQLDVDVPSYGYTLTYLIEATVQFENTANLVFQNNSRLVSCQLGSDPAWTFRLAGAGGVTDRLPMTLHTMVAKVWGNSTAVTLSCGVSDGGTDRSYVFARTRRLTATKLEAFTTQP